MITGEAGLGLKPGVQAQVADLPGRLRCVGMEANIPHHS